MAKYSLSKYILSIKPSTDLASAINDFGTISIGGEGSYLDNITITPNGRLWSTTGFATGGWVHDKNLDRTGTVSITLNQMSDAVQKFIRLCETFYESDYDGFTLTLTTNEVDKKVVATCIDCYIQQIPAQAFQASAQTQTWTFTCGKITFS